MNDQHATPVYIPLINPNEHDASLVSLHISEGQHITSNTILCTLETTKSTHDVYAEMDGFVVGLKVSVGQTVSAGDILCFLASTPDWKPSAKKTDLNQRPNTDEIPDGLRITKPALSFAKEHNLDLTKLPTNQLVTTDVVHSFLDYSIPPASEVVDIGVYDDINTALLIYGGGGHGKSLIELVLAMGSYQIIGIIDDGVPVGTKILGYPVLGNHQILPGLNHRGIHLALNAIGGIDNINTRVKAFNHLEEAGFSCPMVVHPTAFIEKSAILELGTQVFPHAYIGSDVRVEFGCIINTGSIVSHDCVLGKYTNLSPGATLAGNVKLGEGVLVGMQATININVLVGSRARIGNGATVKADLFEGGIVRAGTAWPK